MEMMKFRQSATIAMPLKYLNSFWISLEMPLINFKIKLKFKWINYCGFSAAGEDNVNDGDDKIIFSIKYTKLYVPVVILSSRDNQKLSPPHSKVFETSVYWNEYIKK